MTRAAEQQAYRIPDAPRFGSAVREALFDFYYNSWRLVPANLLWGIGLLIVIGVLFSVPLAALPLAVLLAVPAAGIFRLATLIARDQSVALSDSLRAWRRFLWPALTSGAVLVTINFVLALNIVLGVANPELILWIIATMSVWGLIATWAVALPFWALLTDPLREDVPLRAKLRLAAVLVLVSPLRFGLLLLLAAVVLVASTIFFAALVTISVAIVALVVTRYSLPAADRLEGRETQAMPE